jgi:transcriptional regulator with XRE-family HTH domain
MKNRIKYWRTLRGLSIRDLSEKSGVATQTIVNAEKPNAGLPIPRVRQKLAAALGIKPEDLIEQAALENLIANESKKASEQIDAAGLLEDKSRLPENNNQQSVTETDTPQIRAA